MSIELRIPEVGESIREVQIGRWLKKEGDTVEQDEDLVELETDKASLELPAPAAGVLTEILKREGETVAVGEVVAYLECDKSEAAGDRADVNRQEPAQQKARKTDSTVSDEKPTSAEVSLGDEGAGQAGESGGRQPLAKHFVDKTAILSSSDESEDADGTVSVTPSARRALRQYGLTPADVEFAGSRIERDDVLKHVEQQHVAKSSMESKGQIQRQADQHGAAEQAVSELEETVPMSLIRRRIAQRLVDAQQQAALLTTFNEIDMSAINRLRATHRERFHDKYGIKLGIMSFFVKATIDALKQLPELNARIREDQIVYRNYYHMGIAIGSDKGLVVPVLRNAERLSFADIERAIDDFATRAAENKLAPQELEGGTFTITNGGVFGSLLSTPIVNPPQSGVLGMHAIQERPVAREAEVVIRPMMYVALTYDHRIVDGRGAVTFLRRVKEAIEDPARMLLEV